MSPIPGSSPNSTARTSHMAQCIHITPRAYILPFLLLLLCHHLPLWVFWAALSPPTTNYEDACDRTFSQWISQTFVLHLAIPVTCIVSIIVTFLSPIHRPLANHRTCFSETPLIVAVFLLYVALASWDAYGIHRSRRCFPASLHHRGGILAFDLTVSILVLLAWIASMCSASPLSEADMRAKFTSRLRCLTYAFVCRRYDNDDETTDMFSFLAESMAQFFYVRRRDHVPRIDISHPLVSKSTYLYVGDAPAASRCPLRPPSRGQASERQLLAPRSPSAVMTDVSPSIYVVRAHSASRHGPRDDVSFVCYAGVTHTSVQYISGANELFKVPFSVCRDDVKKEVVVAIRGSFSWHDVLTDALGRTVPMAAHEATRGLHLLHELQSGTLRALFWDFAQSNCRRDDPNASWRVVLTGHSLGGGIAALLTLMLRKDLRVHGFLFAPMAVLDGGTADWSAPFMTTFIYGDDWIPRLTTSNLVRYMRLRNEIMVAYQHVSNAMLLSVYLAWFNPTRLTPQIHPEWADLELLEPDAGAIPGTIFQIAPTQPARMCPCEKLLGRQELECVRRHRHEFDRIWVTYRAVVDHFPHHYDQTLLRMQQSMRETQAHDVL
ncbi:hypothetical protein DYB30_002084 [Aphanomyces astaci]|uniref:sn-1-specific diacylglycerol lipase n=1 Tax=Aphanomyces astaci TaxID=112090 RepID=A0A397DFJ3_APHAT|nr:hypothetical protein DYB30_002084 [Aphanomyces astaci]